MRVCGRTHARAWSPLVLPRRHGRPAHTPRRPRRHRTRAAPELWRAARGEPRRRPPAAHASRRNTTYCPHGARLCAPYHSAMQAVCRTCHQPRCARTAHGVRAGVPRAAANDASNCVAGDSTHSDASPRRWPLIPPGVCAGNLLRPCQRHASVTGVRITRNRDRYGCRTRIPSTTPHTLAAGWLAPRAPSALRAATARVP